MTGQVTPLSLAQRKIRLVMGLRREGVADTRVLGAIERIPRERFVPATFRDQAYEDTALPIGHGQTISQPLVVALMTEALRVGDRHKVLEIGTGSGYQTAVLAQLCRRVYSVERIEPLLRQAEAILAELRLTNVTAKLADGHIGWPAQAPFDRILLTAASGPSPPRALTQQLAVGGILVAPVTEGTGQVVIRLTRTEEGFDREPLWPVRFVPLLPDIARQSPGEATG